MAAAATRKVAGPQPAHERRRREHGRRRRRQRRRLSAPRPDFRGEEDGARRLRRWRWQILPALPLSAPSGRASRGLGVGREEEEHGWRRLLLDRPLLVQGHFLTVLPTVIPTMIPTGYPTESPNASSTSSPTVLPSASPRPLPAVSPTVSPTTRLAMIAGVLANCAPP